MPSDQPQSAQIARARQIACASANLRNRTRETRKPLPVFVVVGLLNNPDTALNDLAAADLINNAIDLT